MFALDRLFNSKQDTNRYKWGYLAAGASTLIGGIWTTYTLLRNREDDQNPAGNNGAVSGDILESLTKDELYEKAQEENLDGRSSMNKDELIEALSH